MLACCGHDAQHRPEAANNEIAARSMGCCRPDFHELSAMGDDDAARHLRCRQIRDFTASSHAGHARYGRSRRRQHKWRRCLRAGRAAESGGIKMPPERRYVRARPIRRTSLEATSSGVLARRVIRASAAQPRRFLAVARARHPCRHAGGRSGGQHRNRGRQISSRASPADVASDEWSS